MGFLEIFLPISLLVLSFLLKLLIDRHVSIPIFIECGLELPVDIAILSLSFIVAFTISRGDDTSMGLTYFIVALIITILLVFGWRRSLYFFQIKKHIQWSIIVIVSLVISSVGLIESINLLSGG